MNKYVVTIYSENTSCIEMGGDMDALEVARLAKKHDVTEFCVEWYDAIVALANENSIGAIVDNCKLGDDGRLNHTSLHLFLTTLDKLKIEARKV